MEQDETQLKVMAAQFWRVVSPFVYTVLLGAFMRFATLGYLTPQQATDLTKWVMDAAVAGAPVALGVYFAWKKTRKQMIQSTDALPGVLGVAVTPEVDKQLPNTPTVTTPEKLVQRIANG
jgi:hypothetical protein